MIKNEEIKNENDSSCSLKSCKLHLKSIVFWDVDTQRDFMIEKDLQGKNRPLYVPGSKEIRSRLKQITDFSIKHRITRCYTLDCHRASDWKQKILAEEMKVFKPHCIAGTEGFQKIPETNRRSNCVIRKSHYDVFTEIQVMNNIVSKFKKLNKTLIVIYGVAADYCVRAAALGFIKKGFDVIVLLDAIAGVSPKTTREAISEMRSKGVQFIKFNDLISMFDTRRNMRIQINIESYDYNKIKKLLRNTEFVEDKTINKDRIKDEEGFFRFELDDIRFDISIENNKLLFEAIEEESLKPKIHKKLKSILGDIKFKLDVSKEI